MNLPKPLLEVIDQFEGLPGIGHKTASRLGLYLLNVPQERLARFAAALTDLKQKSIRCKECCNLTETELCDICQDETRDKTTICVVEDVMDVLGIEQTRKYKGVYHVLYGRIDPLNNMGPDDILLPQLMTRVGKEGNDIHEIILATNPTMEGETTAMYIRKLFIELKEEKQFSYTVSRLAYGLPMGGQIEFADYGTLGSALENRKTF